MSRYRPPSAPVSNYITPEGERALSEELEYLWRKERPLVTQQVSDAAALGDRSENAEYIYGKKRLREIDRRVRFLRKRLEYLTIVEQLPTNQAKVYFGAWVVLMDEQEQSLNIRLVGPDEIDPSRNYISIDSPLGKAIMGKQLDDEIKFQSPSGIKHFCIEKIEYRSP
ncbi:MAG: transcription elongation factor GreB [Gammaproteobacteria bacterium]|jgi:transcription elongation factor GreB|nr:transcription elongation factor GreB [Gammaproteobacteria bacterium]